LKEFLKKKCNRTDIPFRDLDVPFLAEFDFYAKTVWKCGNNAALKHIQRIRKVVGLAVISGLLKILPFGQISYSEKGNSISLTLHIIPGYSPTKYLRDYAFCLGLCIYDFVRLRDKTRVSVTFVDDLRHKKHTYSSTDGLFDKMIEGLMEAF
jgi:hypothetical protein